MINVIARTDEHFRNWIQEQNVNPRIVHRVHSVRDANYIRQGQGFVSLTPMVDSHEEEKIRSILKSRKCPELSHNINDWPVSEFA